MSSAQYCLRCKSAELEVLPLSNERITFFQCPECQRQFAQTPGKGLAERWLGPISLVLYGTIFSECPQDRAESIAAYFRQHETPERCEWIVSEIRQELAHPTQQVRDILDQPQSEADLREFLQRVADLLEQGRNPP